jgi:hypothetical protein
MILGARICTAFEGEKEQHFTKPNVSHGQSESTDWRAGWAHKHQVLSILSGFACLPLLLSKRL